MANATAPRPATAHLPETYAFGMVPRTWGTDATVHANEIAPTSSKRSALVLARRRTARGSARFDGQTAHAQRSRPLPSPQPFHRLDPHAAIGAAALP